MKNRLCAALAAALLAGCLLAGCGKREPQRYTTTWFDLFDTVTVVQGYAASQDEWDSQMEALHADLLRYHQLFDIYHHYDGLTNLFDVNAAAADAPVAVEEALLDFLDYGKQMYELTGGACNIAAGAVLRLWHDARETATLPDDAALLDAAAHCGIAALALDRAAGTVAFTDPGLRLDVGAIGKGYGVEQAAQAAEARGLESAVLNVGGNVRAIGAKPDGTAWTGGVENPWQADGPLVDAVELPDGGCLVISGDNQRYFEVDGVRYHHLIDLATLYPARYANSVAVICRDNGLADAMSTALFCMPVADALALAESLPDFEALWMLPDGTTTATSGWAGYTF